MNPLPLIRNRKIYKTSSNEKSCIQCASLNKASLQSFATGDENGKTKIWKIGEKESISSFESNHSISCIAFNDDKRAKHNNSNLLVSGNIGGGIKLYDLNENKLLRNYGGHRSEIKDINFFDSSNDTTLIVSASTDSNVKIWDIRMKTNILTFKGHTNAVNCIDFSPDRSWIVSADCVGHTKLWDISTSKCIHEFHDKQAINHVSFHPKQLVLATAVGKIVRLWDLETMKHISKTSKITTPINKILFPQTIANEFIISVSNQSLRIWQWEPLPVYCMHNISVHWNNKIDDMQYVNGYNDLICLELDKNRVIVWLTDIGIVNETNNGTNTNTNTNTHTIQSDDAYDFDEFDDFNEIEEDICDDSCDEITEIEIPKGLKNMPTEMWTKSFIAAAEIVRTKRKKVAFVSSKELKRSPLKEEGTELNETNDQSLSETNLKFAQFIPRHLVDFDERELIRIKRSIMIEHIPTLRMLSCRLRYLRQLKSLWKKEKTTEFMETVKQIQSDSDCGNNNRLFINFMNSLLSSISKKSFSFRFCYLLLSVIDFNKQMNRNSDDSVIILNYIKFILDKFSSLIIDTLKIKVINEKDVNLMDRMEYCQNGYELLTKRIKSFVITIHSNNKQNEKEHNITIEEVCTKILALIELLN